MTLTLSQELERTDRMNCAGNLYETFDAQDFTGSSGTMAKIKDWIGACSGHEACKLRRSSDTFLPTRLVYVGTAAIPELCLKMRTSLLGQLNVEYLALSHCW